MKATTTKWKHIHMRKLVYLLHVVKRMKRMKRMTPTLNWKNRMQLLNVTIYVALKFDSIKLKLKHK